MKIFLIGLNLLIGSGGIAGGFLALVPSARAAAGIQPSLLVNSPFTSFLFPGLFLLLVIGGGNLLTAWLNWKKKPDSPYYHCLLGLIQILWLSIQCLMLLTFNPLHLLFFILGISQLVGGIVVVKRTKAPLPFAAHQN